MGVLFWLFHAFYSKCPRLVTFCSWFNISQWSFNIKSIYLSIKHFIQWMLLLYAHLNFSDVLLSHSLLLSNCLLENTHTHTQCGMAVDFETYRAHFNWKGSIALHFNDHGIYCGGSQLIHKCVIELMRMNVGLSFKFFFKVPHFNNKFYFLISRSRFGTFWLKKSTMATVNCSRLFNITTFQSQIWVSILQSKLINSILIYCIFFLKNLNNGPVFNLTYPIGQHTQNEFKWIDPEFYTMESKDAKRKVKRNSVRIS